MEWSQSRISNTFSWSSSKKRTIIFIDVDCFAVQAWLQKLRPELIGEDIPIAVVSPDCKNVILAVNYTAKSLGVKRGKGRQAIQDAHRQCKQKGRFLEIIEAGERFGKSDDFLFQIESDKIVKVTQNYIASLIKKSAEIPLERNCHRAIDEFYIDITELLNQEFPSISEIIELTNSRKKHPNINYNNNPTTIMEIWGESTIFYSDLRDKIQSKKMDHDEISPVQGAIIAQNLLKIIKRKTGYEVSAGIGHSKLVAKHACPRNKPMGITIIADSSLEKLQKQTPFQDLNGYGGYTGSRIRKYYEDKIGFSSRSRNVETIQELLLASRLHGDFECAFEDLGFVDYLSKSQELNDLCYFWDNSTVDSIVHPSNFSVSRSFKDFNIWSRIFKERITDLSQDMSARIKYNLKNGRKVTELIVSADIKENFQVGFGFHDFGNKLRLDGKVSSAKINEFIDNFCKHNNLNCSNVSKLKVTAGEIKDIGTCEKMIDIFHGYICEAKETFFERRNRNFRLICMYVIFVLYLFVFVIIPVIIATWFF